VSRVLIAWERRPAAPAADRLRSLVRCVLARFDVGRAEVHIRLTGDGEIRALNSRYRSLDQPTDVLSFPDGDLLPDGRRFLGEIAVSMDAVRRQAVELRHSEGRELDELVLHGVLHLLGHDHEEDSGGMDRLELRLREELLS
jgi:probable rRNA maturation factor